MEGIKPRLRPLQVSMVDEGVVLIDPLGITPQPVVFSSGAVLLLSLMDGNRTINEIAEEFRGITGYDISPVEVLNFVNRLNDWFLLDNENFQRKYRELSSEFINLKVRPMVFAGDAYPENSTELLEMVLPAKRLENLLLVKPKGVVIPHIDPRRGWDVYVEGLRAIYRSDADTFVIFGIAHSYISNPINALPMHFETPLGVVETDLKTLEKLNSSLKFDLFSDPLAFKGEHSVEFPIVFIKALFPEKDIKVLPFIFSGENIGDFRMIEEFINALREVLIGKNALIVASVDMSHMGGRFGDEFLDNEALKYYDKLFLEILESLNPETLISWVKLYQNPTRIDAVPAIYALLEYFGGVGRGKVLSYKISYEEDTNSAVSFASAVIY